MQAFVVAFTWLFTFFIVFSRLSTSVHGKFFPPNYLLGNIAINCGCVSNSTALDGRQWVGETPLLRPIGKSRSSTSAHRLLSADPTPYLTARLSFSYFSYLFQVNSGQKFIRLHFYPDSYHGFENYQDFFTVEANSFTLLQNFSASLAADALGVKYFVKEYCLNVNDTGILQITFFPIQRSRKTTFFFAFVNGIEIISMPTGLYYTPDDKLGPRIVGHNNRFHYVDNSTALELVERLNVGGGTISTVDDIGLFRRWVGDVVYLQESDFQHLNHLSATENTVSPPFVAPPKIYQTSRKLRKNLHLEEHFTWKIPVDLGFSYLLRLHFSFFGFEIPEGATPDFSILMQNLVAESQVNVVQLSGGKKTQVYGDYLVTMKGDKSQGKNDLVISLQSVDELVLGFLKGLEIFKLSNPDNSLASPNPSNPKHTASFWTLKICNILVSFGRSNVIMIALTIFLAIVNSFVYLLRRICEYVFWQERNMQSVPDEPSYHQFSLTEILLATQDFNEALVIGKGGFGKVYKGFIHGRPEILAIKRLRPDSKQGAREFWREIETLSKLRHVHLVSLLGYCMEREEMILVYEYMPRGTIADNLYKFGTDGKERIPLNWEQRLRICIGAARGLDYLHTGIQHGVIHRDVKDTNILLDEKFVAKVSDFGLSKMGKTGETQGEPSSKIKGTIGYLDPHYILTHEPSTQSDVYAFGIVLLVVLSGRPAVERRIFEETKSLLECYRECMTKGEMNEIIDPCLQGEILTRSLTRFIEVVEKCLHHRPKKRPTMAQVVGLLENALEEQTGAMSSTLDTIIGQNAPPGSDQPFEINELQVAPIPEEGIISLHGDGHTSKEIQNANLQIKFEFLRPKGKYLKVTPKPLWGRSWIAFWKFRKPNKKTDPTLRTGRAFTFKDIKLATQNFSDKFIIGKGGFGNVYKGFIDGDTGIVSIKRYSTWGAEEFRAEVEILSTVNYIHVVPFVGYCNESNELIVVYEYMSQGSLSNHLYKNNRSKTIDIPLTWEERLRICIGAAHGLNYLHEVGIIHRDVRDQNIMLDENFVAKILGSGLSKLETLGESESHVSTKMLASPGYLDPSYLDSGKLTKASDVYSFGIVLLVVLSGMPAIDLARPKKHRHVKLWYSACSQDGNFDELIDPKLVGGIRSASLGKFLELINSCLQEDQKVRPIMAQVVANLKESLSLAQMDS